MIQAWIGFLRTSRKSAGRFDDSRRQLIKQRLSLFQIERVEAFDEPAVDRSEKIASLLPLALIAQRRAMLIAARSAQQTWPAMRSLYAVRYFRRMPSCGFQCSPVLAHQAEYWGRRRHCALENVHDHPSLTRMF